MDKTILSQYRQKFSDDLFSSVLPFWEKNAPDTVNGGIRTCLDRKGKVFSAEKSVWMQGRGGWMFAHLYNDYDHDEKWLKIAKSCLDFSKAHCIDPADARMYFIVADDGTPFRKRRYTFSEYFYIMANAEYYKATKETCYLEEARKYYTLVMDIMKDPSKDPFKITPKFLETFPPMQGLADKLVLLLVTRTLRICDQDKTEQYILTEKKLIADILQYHYNPQLGVLLESVGPNGEYIGNLSAGRVINPGHILEGVWGLLREAEELQDKELVAQTEKIYQGALRYGWDEKHGGLLYFIDAEGNPPQAYEHDMKLWWVHAEAIIAAIKLYRLTGNEKYFRDFQDFTDYSFHNFQDEQYGEWYGYLRRDGIPTEPMCKGNVFKGPFHVPRMYCEVLAELKKLEEGC